jgi:hypothetical protein
LTESRRALALAGFFSAIPGAYTSAVYVYTVQDNL